MNQGIMKGVIQMWDALLYEKLSKERTQPIHDLISRIATKTFNHIIDIGCGTGLSTYPLCKQWPDAEIIGVDLSNEMLQKAKQMPNSITWLQRDCSKPLDDLGKFDLVFSNAFLQWLKNQEEFLKNTSSLLSENGVLAIQLPDFVSMPASDCINTVAATYGELFSGIDQELYRNYSVEKYYDILRQHYSAAEVWHVSYYHVMTDHNAILDFIKGAGLRPFLARLIPVVIDQFLEDVLNELKTCYPVGKDGNVLFEFKRMFLLAEK